MGRIKGGRPPVKPQYFTGRVALKEVASTTARPRARILEVRFHAGARTKMHRHSGGQILVAICGAGSLVTYKQTSSKIARVSRTPLSAGKAVYIPPKVLHTHGSVSKSRTFSHIAINLSAGAGEMKTLWFDSDFSSWLKKIP